MNRSLALRRARGLTLIEAMVALAVMGVGMLGLVGLQSALRGNADLAKQRSEAMRLAQEQIERWRSFEAIAATPAPVIDFDEMSCGSAAAPVAGFTVTNASYTLAQDIVCAATAFDPALKQLRVDASWADRAGSAQSVRLATIVARSDPELGGSLSLPGSAIGMLPPAGRHPAIPRAAHDEGDGTSTFTPPGPPGSTVRWVFDNVTGFITQMCDPSPTACTPGTWLLLSGYLRFALVDPPTPHASEFPPSPPLAGVTVQVDQTLPTTGTVACAVQEVLASPEPASIAYFCPMPVTDSVRSWSGRSDVDPATLALATTASDPDPGRYRVCRYTPAAADPETPPNIDHPPVYDTVTGPLANQNFLVIKAGDATTPYACPGDDTTTPYLDGNTRPHQPAP
jgi:Tfp pilus assembly protein PilV